ncbi:hypothetical protein C4D60_Mb06t02290 [Musa balbisiana]|uniref:hypoxanthine phosphoribosyltransferase n=1 Tax=Musa balbisiana TaxID=52838 RepID=A0A4S8IK06_MUSBA|nr:hypothetical protein C4D60_Mb06t02290 [Musa balbisiana]
MGSEFDIERILWTEQEIAGRVAELAAEISGDLIGAAGPPVVFVGVATGAFLFLADLVRRITLPLAVDFVRVESYGSGTESNGAPKISGDLKIDIRGKHVVLVEDIVDTGNTVSCLIPHLRAKGAISVSVCTFLDKPARRKVHFELVGGGKFYRGFECPDSFVVGYGMDYDELYRNLPYVGVLKPEIRAFLVLPGCQRGFKRRFLSRNSPMASLHSAILSALQFHQRPSNLGLRIDSTRTLTTTIAPPRLLEPFPLSTKTLASDRLVPPLPKISCSRTPQIRPLSRQNANFLRRIAGGAAVLLIGSLVFLGRLGTRSALALDGAQRSNFSAPLEEKIDASGEDEVEMYARVLQKNPKDVEALKVVLYGKLKKGKREEAVRLVERLIELEPDEVEWRLLQGLCYELMGKLDKAKRLFKDILKERPLLIRALHGLALAMHKSRESAAAFEMLHKALDLAHRENRVTDERNIKILIAQMHAIMGDLEGASQHFQDLVNEDPRDFRPYLCQGVIYSLLDKKKEADEQFEIYRSLLPDEFPQRSFIDDVIQSAKAEPSSLGKNSNLNIHPKK